MPHRNPSMTTKNASTFPSCCVASGLACISPIECFTLLCAGGISTSIARCILDPEVHLAADTAPLMHQLRHLGSDAVLRWQTEACAPPKLMLEHALLREAVRAS
jgi:hypothetical protein